MALIKQNALTVLPRKWTLCGRFYETVLQYHYFYLQFERWLLLTFWKAAFDKVYYGFIHPSRGGVKALPRAHLLTALSFSPLAYQMKCVFFNWKIVRRIVYKVGRMVMEARRRIHWVVREISATFATFFGILSVNTFRKMSFSPWA